MDIALDAVSPAPDPRPQPAARPPAAEPPADGLHVSFHDVLSALNPLQYLPVIGTLYRAMTGDEIPEPVRRIGSLIVSGLLGGPVGVGINLATTAAEKISGIDLDEAGQTLMAGNNPFAAAPTAAVPAASPEPAEPAPSSLAAAWSPAQLATYGVSSTGDGTLKLADLTGSDVLNSLELSRIQTAQAAYNRALSLAA